MKPASECPPVQGGNVSGQSVIGAIFPRWTTESSREYDHSRFHRFRYVISESLVPQSRPRCRRTDALGGNGQGEAPLHDALASDRRRPHGASQSAERTRSGNLLAGMQGRRSSACAVVDVSPQRAKKAHVGASGRKIACSRHTRCSTTPPHQGSAGRAAQHQNAPAAVLKRGAKSPFGGHDARSPCSRTKRHLAAMPFQPARRQRPPAAGALPPSSLRHGSAPACDPRGRTGPWAHTLKPASAALQCAPVGAPPRAHKCPPGFTSGAPRFREIVPRLGDQVPRTQQAGELACGWVPPPAEAPHPGAPRSNLARGGLAPARAPRHPPPGCPSRPPQSQ